MSYHSPTDLTEALALAAHPGVQVIAGGTDVFPAARRGQFAAQYLDVTRVAGLRGITTGPDGVRLRAATRWSDIAQADLPPAFDALRTAARAVGGVQIQNAGTLAGNLCNASPAADGVPPLLALDASVEVASAARGVRTLPLQAFLLGPRQTARAPDELMTAILVPPPEPGATSAFEKLGSRRYLVISITMTAVVLDCDARGRIRAARVAVGACAATAQRLPALEAALIGQDAARPQIAPAHLSPLAPIDDVRGSADFRRDVVAVQCARAIRKAAGHE